VALVSSIAMAVPGPPSEQTLESTRIGSEVHKDLVTLPYYGVFDNLSYSVDGATVTLFGDVTRPITRQSAEQRVRRIKGVQQVVNRIEVLPLSNFDDAIRWRTFRAVFGSGGLYRYGLGANPSIHIIVNNGHVTLEGVVSNPMDKQLAYFAANGVRGVFSVTNNLQVVKAS
jgi:hyperosmotically inducible protein